MPVLAPINLALYTEHRGFDLIRYNKLLYEKNLPYQRIRFVDKLAPYSFQAYLCCMLSNLNIKNLMAKGTFKYYVIERGGWVKPNDYSKVWNSSAA